ncbi:MAG TPA: hypothetical protein VN634_20635 [Candidatus Limnocylindrales bacterium]|nr:hypothetical protein [Candidatus Limnocylindrales bacterium]
MNKPIRKIMLGVASLMVVAASSTPVHAQVGKKISTAAVTVGGAVIAAYPSETTAVSVAVPTGYKSSASFLKVTANYQVACSGTDKISSRVVVGGQTMEDGSLPYEFSGSTSGYRVLSKSYYLASEKLGGPAVPPGSTVEVRLNSDLGTSCLLYQATIIVETTK